MGWGANYLMFGFQIVIFVVYGCRFQAIFAVTGEAASGEAFEGLDLAGLEAGRVSVDLDGRAPATRVRDGVAGGGRWRLADDREGRSPPGSAADDPRRG